MQIKTSFRFFRGFACAAALSMAALSASAASADFWGLSVFRGFPESIIPDPSVKVEAMGSVPEQIKLNAWIDRGPSAPDALVLKVNLTAPQAKRICVAYAGFESVGLLHRGRRSAAALDEAEHKCSDQTGLDDGTPFKDTVYLQRRDIPEYSPTHRPNFENLPETEKRRRASFRDGYIIILVSLDGKPSMFKITSQSLNLDAIVIK